MLPADALYGPSGGLPMANRDIASESDGAVVRLKARLLAVARLAVARSNSE